MGLVCKILSVGVVYPALLSLLLFSYLSLNAESVIFVSLTPPTLEIKSNRIFSGYFFGFISHQTSLGETNFMIIFFTCLFLIYVIFSHVHFWTILIKFSTSIISCSWVSNAIFRFILLSKSLLKISQSVYLSVSVGVLSKCKILTFISKYIAEWSELIS